MRIRILRENSEIINFALSYHSGPLSMDNKWNEDNKMNEE